MAEAFMELQIPSADRGDTLQRVDRSSEVVKPVVPQNTSGVRPKKAGRRGRKPTKVDVKVKLERSRQSARECRARKKLRYQYIEELVADRERAIHLLREELEQYKKWCHKIDQGNTPPEIFRNLGDILDADICYAGDPLPSSDKNG